MAAHLASTFPLASFATAVTVWSPGARSFSTVAGVPSVPGMLIGAPPSTETSYTFGAKVQKVAERAVSCTGTFSPDLNVAPSFGDTIANPVAQSFIVLVHAERARARAPTTRSPRVPARNRFEAISFLL